MLELSDFFIPKEVLHRDKQMKEIRDIFLNFKKYAIMELSNPPDNDIKFDLHSLHDSSKTL